MNRIALPVLTLAASLVPLLCRAVEPTAAEATAIAEIEKLGGKVTVNESSPGRPATVNLGSTNVTDAALVHLAGMPRLESLDLHDTRITDAGLIHLEGLTQLQSLDLAKHGANRRSDSVTSRT